MTAFIGHSGKGKPFMAEEQMSGCPGLGVGEIGLQRVSPVRLLGWWNGSIFWLWWQLHKFLKH